MTTRLKSYAQDRNDREEFDLKQVEIRGKIVAHLKSDYSGSEGRFVTQLEKDLVNIFNSTPSVTDAKTLAMWKKLGPFPLAQELDDEKLKIDKRLNIDKEVKPVSGRTYDGQMLTLGGPTEEHGIGRV